MAAKRVGSFRSRVRHFPCKALGLVPDIVSGLNGSLVDKLRTLLEREDYAGILELDINPDEYTDPVRFRDDYLAVSILSKFPGFDLGINHAKVAIGKFLDAEHICLKTNERLALLQDTKTTMVSLASYIHMARANIARALGEFSWTDAECYFSFSHGASTRLKRKQGDPTYKYSGKPEVTPSCAALAVCAISRIPLWRENLEALYGKNPNDWVKLVAGNRITTVPKNAKTDRCIAIEPDMNMFIQKGIGALIRNALKYQGINLNDQSVNQRLAARAYFDGLATIDLKAASDTISSELVKLLLPDDWYFAIMQSRSEGGFLPDGTFHKYQKVSSMGNGYTFELESLIFWALAKAVISMDGGSTVLGVYGDDIVIHQEHSAHLIWLLKEVGFSTNVEKTFVRGAFFESCGKHYFQGMDVTPVYIRKPISDDFRLIWLANSIRRMSYRLLETACESRFKEGYEKVVDQLPLALQKRVLPDNSGDGGLIGSWDEIRPVFSKKTGLYSAKILEPRTRKYRPNGFQGLLAAWQTLPTLPHLCFSGWGGRTCLSVRPSGCIGYEYAAPSENLYETSVASELFRFATVQLGRWEDIPSW